MPDEQSPAMPDIRTVTRTQMIRVLAAEGLLETVQAAIAAADPLTRELWLSPTIERDDPALVALATQLGIEAQLPELFASAHVL